MNIGKRLFAVGICVLASLILVVFWWRHASDARSKANVTASLGETNRHAAFPVRKRPFPQRAAVEPPAENFAENTEALAQQPVEARMKFASELEAKSPAELFDLWLDGAKAKTDSLKLDFIADALATRLRDGQADSSAVLRQMQEFFLDSSNEEYSRSQIAQILGQAATRETLAVLLELLESSQQPESRAWLLQQVVKASQNNWEGRFHEDFSDLLGNAWQSATAQPDSLAALGFAIASVGSPKGLELLFSQIKGGGQTINEFEQKAEDKAWVAFGSLEQVRNLAAVPFLDAELNAAQPDSIVTSAAGYCLAKMGQPEATAVLLRWVQTTPSDVSGYVSAWFSLMRDGGSVEVVDAAVKQATFVNPLNKDALSSVLTVWLSNRSENLRPPVGP